jgi:undecaprenol kinase/diacylglycerol kinase (ATP)
MLGFNHAFRGLFQLVRTERNFKIQLFALLLVIVLGFSLRISTNDWLILVLISTLVLTLEIINSAIEKTCDLISKEKNNQIKIIKDAGAAAVLLASIASIIIGAIIFYPYVFVS